MIQFYTNHACEYRIEYNFKKFLAYPRGNQHNLFSAVSNINIIISEFAIFICILK